MLYWGEVIYLLLTRHDYDTAGVLSGSALDAHAVTDYAVCLRAAKGNSLTLKIFCHEAVCGLIGKSAECPGAEYVFRSEQLLGELMYLALHLTGEVEVDIRRLFSVKAEERFKGNVLTVLRQLLSAHRAVFRRHIKA